MITFYLSGHPQNPVKNLIKEAGEVIMIAELYLINLITFLFDVKVEAVETEVTSTANDSKIIEEAVY